MRRQPNLIECWLTTAALLAGAGLSAGPATAAAQQHRNGAGVVTGGSRPPDTAPVEGKPLETRQPVGVGQKPAFAGQTRALAVITRTPYEAKVMTEGLNKPWGFAFLPDGKILLTEKPGTMRLIDAQTGKIVKEVSGVPQVKYGGDAGLLDLVLDPQFATNRRVYFTYIEPRGPEYTTASDPQPKQDNGLTVARAKLSDDEGSLSELVTILRVEPSIPGLAHYGSRLAFDKQGFLYVSTSERFYYPTRGQAQSLFSLLGKVLRITTDGKPAPGNPFYREQDFEDHPRAEIWSLGQRNPQGLAFHPETGELWDSEHGPQGGDEINVIKPGKNYGWPVIAYGSNYDATLFDGELEQESGGRPRPAAPQLNAGSLTAKEGMAQPVYYWDPSIAPSGMTFYDGKLMSEWKGNLFVAGLAGQHVSRLVFDPHDGHKVIGEERLLLDQHERMRDVQEGPDGALWVVTDDADGRLIRIAPRQ